MDEGEKLSSNLQAVMTHDFLNLPNWFKPRELKEFSEGLLTYTLFDQLHQCSSELKC